jgi:type II secretory pathway pseudopilin PulG
MPQGSNSMTQKSTSPHLALRFALSLTRQLSANRRHPDQGLTLIEGLVAIIVITVTLVSITPPIFWATGTRVQNRKAEQASQLAQGEVDRVRTLLERGGYTLAQLPPIAPGANNANIRQAGIAPAPTASSGTMVSSNSTCNTDTGIPPAFGRYTAIDTDNLPGPCRAEFLIQTFRSPGVDENGAELTLASTSLPHGFVMGVRVYASVAETELAAGRGQTQQASLKGTSGLGGQRFRPLAVQYTTIVRSSASQNLSVYRTLCPTTSRGTGQC